MASNRLRTAVFAGLAWASSAGVVGFHSAAAAQSAQAPAPVACVPACSPGYFCDAGQCKSQCNPACGAGETCVEGVEGRYCALVVTAGSDSPPVLSPLEERLRRQQLNLERRAERERSRLIPRLTVMAGFAHSDDDDGPGPKVPDMTVLALRVGGRTNFSPHFGVHAEGGVNLGNARDPYLATADLNGGGSTTVYAVAGSGGFFFNFARMYAGPVAALEWRGYGRDTVQTTQGPVPIDRTGSSLHAAFGGQLGLLTMARDQLDMNVRASYVGRDDVVQVMIMAGYHFLPTP
jgi:hypothetical protein